MKTLCQLTTLSLLLVMLPAACKKEKNDPNNGSTTGNNTNTTTTEKGTLLFHLHTFLDQDEVDAYNITYTTSSGRKVSLSRAQFYISEIQLEKLDGSIYDVTDKKILKVFESDVYEIGEVDAGNYKAVKFKVGLPAATNALNPSLSNDSVILKRSEMWFNPSAAQPDGYVFLNVQGLIDTSSDLSAKMFPFTYKIGTNANYKQVTVTQNYGVTPNTVNYFHMVADYNRLFSGITLDSLHLNVTTTANNVSTTATQITNNIPNMFGVEY